MNEEEIHEEVDEVIFKQRAKEKRTLGHKCADAVTQAGGSWGFIVGFSIFFLCWIIVNTFFIKADTYPYILLNLILSCLAVFQAPFILMSQNRASEIDRQREEENYKTNLREEMQVKLLNQKIDKVLTLLNKQQPLKTIKTRSKKNVD